MFSLFKKKKAVEPIDDRRQAIEASREGKVSTEPIDDRRQAIESSREAAKPTNKKPVKKTTPKKKK
jgi:hypothetical protein